MKKTTSLILLILCFAFMVQGQENQTPVTRPKVGLVLSGGGAKGLAHIGVIKVLEEAGIKPDYIAGTSMGSIIGGLYACGYSPHQMDSIVQRIDWSVILSDMIPLTDVVPVEKNDYNRFQLEFDITKDGLTIPSGVVRGQRISELLSELTWNVANIEDFDQLPIPFRCVAADLTKSKTHVFKGGDLMLAMRSSMAIPSIFTPVKLDSMLLVDGGVLDNFPVTTALDMGADIIIGVNVGFKDNPTIEEMNSLPKVLIRSTVIGSNRALLEAIDLADYVITPELNQFTMTSFFEGNAIIEQGEIAARKYFNTFKHLADSLDAIAPYQKNAEPTVDEKILVNDIEIKNRKNISLNFFYSNLGFEEGDSIDLNDIKKGINHLMGTRFYDKVTYEINKKNGQYRIIFNTKESHNSKAKFSLKYDNELKAGIVANVTLRNLFIKNNRISLTADISEDPRFSGNIINYIGEKQKTGLVTDFYFERTPLPIYRDNAKKYGTFNYNTNRASIGAFFTMHRHSMIALKATWKEVTVSEQTGIPEFFDNGIKRFGNGFIKAQAILDINTLNKRFFATRGHQIQLVLNCNLNGYELYKGLDASKSLIQPYTEITDDLYFSALGTLQQHFQLSNTINIKTRLEGGVFLQDAPFLDMFFVGGTNYNQGANGIPFAGLNYREKIVENFTLFKSDINYRIGKMMYGYITANAIYAANYGNSRFDYFPGTLQQKEFILGAGTGFAINSIIGPITFGLGTNASDYKLRFYLSIGYPFK